MDIIREAVRKLEGVTAEPSTTRAVPPDLGDVPVVRAQSVEFSSADSLSPIELSGLRIVHGAMRDENVYTAFSSLRTHIIQRLGKHDCSIVVSSVCPGGGASFVAMNLAAAFASDSASSAVLVDCDFSGSRYSELGDNDSVQGITDYIYGSAAVPLDQLMTDVGVSRLRVLTGGKMRSNRTEFFTRPRAKQMFTELCSQNRDRTVVVDAPPASVSANANVIAAYCDAVLLVVPYGRATQQDVRVAARSFPRGKVLGSVFNDVPQWRIAKK